MIIFFFNSHNPTTPSFLTMPKIYQSREVSAENLRFKESSKNQYGGTRVPIRYVGDSESEGVLYFQLPKMTAPFGAGKPKAQGVVVEDSKYGLDLQFDMSNPAHARAHKFLTDFDERALSTAMEHRNDWLGKPRLQREVLEEFYVNQVKTSEAADGTRYPDRFKVTLPQREDGSFQFRLYSADGEEIKIDRDCPEQIELIIPAKAQVVLLMRCKQVWVGAGKLGISWAIEQMQVFPPSGIIGTFAIRDEDDM